MPLLFQFLSKMVVISLFFTVWSHIFASVQTYRTILAWGQLITWPCTSHMAVANLKIVSVTILQYVWRNAIYCDFLILRNCVMEALASTAGFLHFQWYIYAFYELDHQAIHPSAAAPAPPIKFSNQLLPTSQKSHSFLIPVYSRNSI